MIDCREITDGTRVRFAGTYGNRYDARHFGQPVEGEGIFVRRQGECVVVEVGKAHLIVDPIELEVL